MVATYRFDDRETEKSVRIGGWSYLWAALFGVLYLLFKAGPKRLLQATLLTASCTAALIVLILVTSRFLPQSVQLIVIVLGVSAILFIQSIKTLALIKKSYYLRGWKVEQED